MKKVSLFVLFFSVVFPLSATDSRSDASACDVCAPYIDAFICCVACKAPLYAVRDMFENGRYHPDVCCYCPKNEDCRAFYWSTKVAYASSRDLPRPYYADIDVYSRDGMCLKVREEIDAQYKDALLRIDQILRIYHHFLESRHAPSVEYSSWASTAIDKLNGESVEFLTSSSVGPCVRQNALSLSVGGATDKELDRARAASESVFSRFAAAVGRALGRRPRGDSLSGGGSAGPGGPLGGAGGPGSPA